MNETMPTQAHNAGLIELAGAVEQAKINQLPSLDAPNRTQGDHWGENNRVRYEVTDEITGTGAVVEADRYAHGLSGARESVNHALSMSSDNNSLPVQSVLLGHENTAFRYVQTSDDIAPGLQIEATVSGRVTQHTPTFAKTHREYRTLVHAGEKTETTEGSSEIDADNIDVNIGHTHADGTTTVNKLTGKNAERAAEIISARAARALGNVASSSSIYRKAS